MVLPRYVSRLLQGVALVLPVALMTMFPPATMLAKGKGKTPKVPEAKPAPDPASEASKKKEAEERTKISQRRGASRTIATGPQGVLGAAPTSRPELRGTLG